VYEVRSFLENVSIHLNDWTNKFSGRGVVR